MNPLWIWLVFKWVWLVGIVGGQMEDVQAMAGWDKAGGGWGGGAEKGLVAATERGGQRRPTGSPGGFVWMSRNASDG
jgi:hypothetical protein